MKKLKSLTNSLRGMIKSIGNDVSMVVHSEVESKDSNMFIATTRTMVTVMNDFLAISQQLDLGHYWDLKTDTQHMVHACRLSRFKWCDLLSEQLSIPKTLWFVIKCSQVGSTSTGPSE